MTIRISNLSKSYNKKSLFHIPSLDLNEGFTCLFGPSGCGKTTLGRIISGFEKPDSGKIEGINGLPTVLFQENRLFEGVTALENVCSVVSRKDGAEISSKYLLDLGLELDDLNKLPSELSGGMARRVAIARALLFAKYKGGNFVLLDEPFTGLDAESKKIVSEVIKKELSGKNVLAITHNEEDAELLSGKILIFSSSVQ